LPDAATQDLRAVLLRRRQLIEMLTAERNRLASAPRRIHDAIQAHITWLEGQLRDVDTDLTRAIEASPLWQATDEVLRSIPGVGPVLSRTMRAQVPALGTLGATPLAAWIGVAPFNRDSGTLRGRRTVYGGRAEVRAVLSMGALVATRHHPVIKAFTSACVLRAKPRKSP
jgi:transposase